jgi:Holliday junction resolvase RusA-like endonuclease
VVARLADEIYLDFDCRFSVHGTVPVPQGSHKSVPTGWHVSKRTGQRERTHQIVDSNRGLPAWRRKVLSAAVRAWQGRPPMDGEVLVVLWFGFVRPENQRRASGELRPDVPKMKRTAPDIDKLARAVLDALTEAGVIQSDARVCGLIALKGYTPSPLLICGVRER